MYNEELHAESSLDTVWVVTDKDDEVDWPNLDRGSKRLRNNGLDYLLKI
jgi:hypothetical protein